MMGQALENRHLGVVQHMPAKRLHILVVTPLSDTAELLRDAFTATIGATLEILPDMDKARHLLATKPYDVVAIDPNRSPGGFELLKYIKDNYRWTATLIGTDNQEPEFLRQAIHCHVDGLVLRPATAADFMEQAMMLAQQANARRSQQQKRVLAIGAHPDDVEIGCGGTLARHFADYDVIRILTLSRGAAGGDINSRLAEAHDAAAMLGAKLQIENLPDTAISAGRETIAIIQEAVQKLNPTHVYTHSIEDTHQDHRAVHSASLVAVRNIPNVFCYQTPSSTAQFMPQRYVDITPFIDKKLKLIGAYKSQVDRMSSIQPDVIFTSARYWGRFAGYVLAEPLQVIREKDVIEGTFPLRDDSLAAESDIEGS